MSEKLDSIRKEIAPFIQQNSFSGADKKFVSRVFKTWQESGLSGKEFRNETGISHHQLSAISRIGTRELRNHSNRKKRPYRKRINAFQEVKITPPTKTSSLVITSPTGIRVELSI